MGKTRESVTEEERAAYWTAIDVLAAKIGKALQEVAPEDRRARMEAEVEDRAPSSTGRYAGKPIFWIPYIVFVTRNTDSANCLLEDWAESLDEDRVETLGLEERLENGLAVEDLQDLDTLDDWRRAGCPVEGMLMTAVRDDVFDALTRMGLL